MLGCSVEFGFGVVGIESYCLEECGDVCEHVVEVLGGCWEVEVVHVSCKEFGSGIGKGDLVEDSLEANHEEGSR